jgi:tetratricopeptide (TPR) repeat protein
MKRKTISMALTLCLGLALAFAAVEPLPKPQGKDAQKKMGKAEKALKDKDLVAALALYNEVIVLEPTYGPAYFFTAQINRSMGNNDLAITLYEKTLELTPGFTQALNEYVRTLLILSQKAIEGRDLAKAAGYYEKIMNIKGIDATHPKELQHAVYQMGTVAYSQQNFDKSIAAFQRFLAIPEIEKTAPVNCALAQYMIGVNYSRLNQAENAIPYLEKFIAAPQNETTTPWLSISHYLLANNHYLILDKQIAKIKGENAADALVTFDRIAEAAKASTAILPNLAKAIELKPDLEDAFVKQGNFYFLCQDFDNALKTYTDLIAKFPASPDVANYKSFMQKIEKERDAIKELKAKPKKKTK